MTPPNISGSALYVVPLDEVRCSESQTKDCGSTDFHTPMLCPPRGEISVSAAAVGRLAGH